MSVQAMAWALDVRQTGPLHAGCRLVLVSLADYADPTGRNTYPSAPTLAHRLGITVRYVRECFALLEDLGLIRRGNPDVALHVRADRRPIVWDLALDGIQVTVRISGDDVDLGAEPYDRDLHGVMAGSPREPVDNAPRGEPQRRHGVNHSSPKPSTNPIHLTQVGSEGDPSARERDAGSASHAVPREPRSPIRAMGMTDSNCPTCGVRIYRNHRCRSSALDPASPNRAATIPELVMLNPPPRAEPTLDIAIGDCQWCGRKAPTNRVGVCLRCVMAAAQMGPHPLEERA